MATIRYSLMVCLITIIKFYRLTISTLLGACCRFEPSCSHYAMEAIKMYGCFKGCSLSLRRILRCHPWHPGGMDPVPTTQNGLNQDAKKYVHMPPQSFSKILRNE